MGQKKWSRRFVSERQDACGRPRRWKTLYISEPQVAGVVCPVRKVSTVDKGYMMRAGGGIRVRVLSGQNHAGPASVLENIAVQNWKSSE